MDDPRTNVNKLEKILGVSTAMDYFTNKLILNSESMAKYVEKAEKDEATIKENYEKTIAAFEKGDYASSGFPASIGKEVFMFAYYGSIVESEVLEYSKAQKAWNYYVTDKDKTFFDLAVEFGKEYAGYTKDDENKNK